MRSTNSFAAIFALALLVLPAFNSFSSQSEYEDIRVGRISFIEGNVTMERTSDDDWVEATINTPLLTGDKVYTSYKTKAEIQLEDNVTIRLGADTFLRFNCLDEDCIGLEVLRGTIALRIQKVDYRRPRVEVITPFSDLFIDDHAKVRIKVEKEGRTEIRVRRGEVNVRDGYKTFSLEQNQKLMVESPSHYTSILKGRDDNFDDWCDLRDAMDSVSDSRRYVSETVSGYSDLDYYGDWHVVEEYGAIWRPRVTVMDWSPYRQGYWIERNRCGWTWVSHEPWGWVPYHYGRWIKHRRHGWCWVPRDVVVRHHRPFWSPHLVVFTSGSFGSFFNFRLTISGYSHDTHCIGWFPLGPHDPWSPHYGRRHNNDRNHSRPDRYQNQHEEGSVTIIPREDIGLNRYERLQRSTLKSSNQKVSVGPNLKPHLGGKVPPKSTSSRIVSPDKSSGSVKTSGSKTSSQTRRERSPSIKLENSSSPRSPVKESSPPKTTRNNPTDRGSSLTTERITRNPVKVESSRNYQPIKTETINRNSSRYPEKNYPAPLLIGKPPKQESQPKPGYS